MKNLSTEIHILVVFGFGSQTFICGFNRQNICSVSLNPIPTGHGLNQPIYSYHVTQANRNRVKRTFRSIVNFQIGQDIIVWYVLVQYITLP